MAIITADSVHAATNPMIIPEALFLSCSDKARVGISPNLLGVAMPPTCPQRVDIIAFLKDIFSILHTAHCHFMDSASILHGMSVRHATRKYQLVVKFDANCSNRVVYSLYVTSL